MNARVERFLEDPLCTPTGIDALLAAGAIDAGSAERSRRELALLSTVPAPEEQPYDAELEASAERLLGALFAEVRPGGEPGWDPIAYQRFQEALTALVIVGALSYERARPWYERQSRTLLTMRPPQEPEPEPLVPFGASSLLDVVPGPPEQREGMRVTCLELYADCVLLRCHQVLPAEPEDPVARRELLHTAFTLDDDAGTTYALASIPRHRDCPPKANGPWPVARSMLQAFTPGVPLTARSFTIGWRDQSFQIGAPGTAP